MIPEAQANMLARAAAGQRSGGIVGRIMKFAKGKYLTGDDVIPLGRRLVAHASEWAFGWNRWENGLLTDQRIGKACDGFEAADRTDLPDLDQSKWGKDPSGKPQDPWSQQSYLPLSDAETSEILTFVSASHGGRGAIGDLCAVAAQNFPRGMPIIELDVKSYRHRSFGRIETPNFQIVGWSGGKAADFNDEPEF